MSSAHTNNYPKLHNAAWPGVVGKGGEGEPPIDLDTMLDLTAAAEFEGVRFDGFGAPEGCVGVVVLGCVDEQRPSAGLGVRERDGCRDDPV